MKRVTVDVSSLSLHDVIFVEPTIEALYYKFAPCEIVLETWDGYFPFFEHHPLISECVVPQLPAEASTENIPVHLKAAPGTSDLFLPLVDTLALDARVSLARKTPQIFLPDRPADTDTIVLVQTSHDIKGWPTERVSQLSAVGAEIVWLENPKSVDDTRDALRTLGSASLVVGPDCWATQAAAALNVRVIIGMTEDGERFRKPFNAVVARPDWDDIFKKVRDTWFERRYPNFLNTGNAADFIKCKAKEYMKSGYVDVGCSQWPLMNGIPVDKQNRHVIENAEDGAYSGVFSSHCLEHVPEWEKELALWHRIIQPHGILFLYLPHPQCEPWHAETGSWVGKEHVWNPEAVTLVRFLREELNFNILEYTSRPDPLWSFFVVARKQ